MVTSTTNSLTTATPANYKYNYTYYPDGKQKTKSDSTGTKEYSYDGRGQLVKSVLGGRSAAADNTVIADATGIHIETPAKVQIDKSGQERYFKFTPTTAGTYIFTSSDPGSSDPIGSLYNTNKTVLVTDDNSGDGKNFSISYNLSANVEYFIRAKMADNNLGSYTLLVTKQGGIGSTNLNSALNLYESAPARVEGTVDRYFKFTPSRTGKYIIASTDNGNLNPYVYLYNSGWSEITRNDDGDGGNGRNFKLEYGLTAGLTYYVRASSVVKTSGSYLFSVRHTDNDIVQEYTYDTNGNRTIFKETSGGKINTTTYEYDENDRLEKEIASQGTIVYNYDNNGNLLSKSDGTTQTYDVLGRMTRYRKSGTDVTYTYYPDDMRRTKGSTTQVWSGDNIALDLNGNNVISSYIYGKKLIMSNYGWYQYDAHGDVVSLTDGNGYVTRNYEYDPYGVQIDNKAGIDNNPYRYGGEYYDVESGYTYLRARYYDPAIGRFITEDPAFDGDNWYIYCGNDPINYIDPSGLKPGKVYKTQNKAAKVWAKKNFGRTRYIRMERSSFIYQKFSNNRFLGYAYTKTVTGNAHSTGSGRSTANKNKANKKGNVTAYIHSHPNSATISSADYKVAINNNVTSYVAMPGSDSSKVELKMYSKQWGGYMESTVKKNIQYSKITKKTKDALVKKYADRWVNHLKSCKWTLCNNDKKWPRE